MLTVDIIILGLALATDAALAAFALALLSPELPLVQKIGRGFYLAFLFGFFQFFMLYLGARGGYFISFSVSMGHLFQLIVAGVFLLMGSKLMIDSFKKNDDGVLVWGFIPTVLIAGATSIDALAAGISFGTLPESHMAALEVGLITFFATLVFYFLSFIVRRLPGAWLQRVSGILFIFMGAKVVFDYMRLGG
jgi:putative Mn2+ efflux pump MntP